MKKLALFFFAILPFGVADAQERKHSHYYDQRSNLFEKLPITSADIVFVGNSITDGAEWSELFSNNNVKNRGISGDISEGVYERLGNVVIGKPAKIFLMIGVNDIARGIEPSVIVDNMQKIIKKIQNDSPKTKIYIQSLLPINADFNMFQEHMKPQMIKDINQQYKALAQKHKLIFIDLYNHFLEKGTDKLAPKYTNDGLHLMGDGYLLWRDIVLPYL